MHCFANTCVCNRSQSLLLSPGTAGTEGALAGEMSGEDGSEVAYGLTASGTTTAGVTPC